MFTGAIVLLWLALAAYAVELREGGRWPGRLATGLAGVAWGALTVGLVRRGLEAGHWPLTNRYEFALCLAWAILAIYLLLEASWRTNVGGPQRGGGAFVLAMALLAAMWAATRPSAERVIAPLLPVLRSVWLQVHVVTAAVGYGAFGVAAGLGVMALIRERIFLKNLLSEEQATRVMERAVALGFPWMTLAIISGAIWAQQAWGRYWGWDPKETWALITWLWYLSILHLLPLRRWRGRRLAVLVVLGFGVVVFSFAGVPWLVRVVRLESLHGF